MIKLITLEDNKPIFNPEVRMFTPFRKIIERDKGSKGDADGRKKSTATKELAFIYWFADPRSNYKESYQDERERTEKIKKLLGLDDKWEIDSVIQEAVDFYTEEIKDDFDIGFLEDAIAAAEKTREYFRNVDYSISIKGKPVYDGKTVMAMLEKTPNTIESLKNARKKIYNSEKLNPKIRGGGTVGRYES